MNLNLMARLGFDQRRRQGYEQATLRAWLQQTGRLLLAELIGTYRLPVSLPVREYGVMRAAFGFHPGTATTRAVMAREDVVARLLATSDVRTSVHRGLVYFSVPLPPEFIDEIDPWALPPASAEGVPFGISEADAPVTWRPDTDYHLLLVGPTGTGKSVVMRLLLKGLLAATDADAFRFAVLGVKAQDWDAALCFRQSWGFHGVDDAPAAVAWLLDEYHRRNETRVKTPRLVIFVDDLLALLDRRSGHPELLSPLTTLLVNSRAAGMHFILGTQAAAANIDGLSVIVKQTPRRVGTGAGSTQEAYLATGVAGSGLERVRRGEVISVEAGQAMSVYVPRFEDDDLARLPGGVPDACPWASSVVSAGRGVSPPSVSAISPVSPDGRPVLRVVAPETTPAKALTPLMGLTEREREIARMLREHKSSHQIAKTLTGQEGGPTYQRAVQEVKGFIVRWLPPVEDAL